MSKASTGTADLAWVARLSCGHWVRFDEPKPVRGEVVHCAKHCDNRRRANLSYPTVQSGPALRDGRARARLQPWSWVRLRGLSNQGRQLACQICWQRRARIEAPAGYPIDSAIAVCGRCHFGRLLADTRHSLCQLPTQLVGYLWARWRDS